MRHTLWLALLALLALLLAGCGSGDPVTPSARSATATPRPTTAVPRTPTRTAPTTTQAKPQTTPRPKPQTKPPTKPQPRTPQAKPSRSTAATRPAPRPPSLKGDTRNAFAFAPLASPGAVTVEGSVPSSRAWSTSKVLVAAAHLDTVAGGDPDRLTADQRRWVTRALTESDMDSVIALRDQIPGSPGAAITAVLRSIGDTRTVAPDRSQGSMQWTVREQVRFMAALNAGRVVSPQASAYLLRTMQPIPAHRWGLGTVGAGAFKGGWLRSGTETRQMGIVDGYAVAIITDAVGPAVLQTDGDSAHVQQMNRLAQLLRARLALEPGGTH